MEEEKKYFEEIGTVPVLCPNCNEKFYAPVSIVKRGDEIKQEFSYPLCPYCCSFLSEDNIIEEAEMPVDTTTGLKKINILHLSNKLDICGLPIRADTYRNCTFGCRYCFANCREGFAKFDDFAVGDVQHLRNYLKRIFEDNNLNDNLLDKFVSERYTIHCGGMADPFQPAEEKYHITKDFIDECNKYGLHIVFSTKSDTVYGADIRPDLHSFQLSVTNVENRTDFEPNVPDIESRYKFYRDLKDRGFKVAIRIQPFIPNVSTLKIVEKFKDADHFILEGLKIVQTNLEHKKEMFEKTGLNSEHFTCMGLLNLRPMIRFNMYKPFIEYFEKNHISYSISDNDLRWIGNNKCCCGDCMVEKATNFNTTALIKKYGLDWTRENVDAELKEAGILDSKVTKYSEVSTISKTYDRLFDSPISPMSPKFQRNPKKLKQIFENDKKIIEKANNKRKKELDEIN